MKKAILMTLLTAFVFGCKTSDVPSLTIIESTLIGKGNLYGAGAEGISEQNLMITDETAWVELMNQMNAVNNVSDGFSEIDIDFTLYQLIAVFEEIKSSGGHSTDLYIVENQNNIIVNITNLAPEGIATAVITQPFHIVKIPISDLPIIFE